MNREGSASRFFASFASFAVKTALNRKERKGRKESHGKVLNAAQRSAG